MVRQAFEAFNRGDHATVTRFLAPDIEWHSLAGPTSDLMRKTSMLSGRFYGVLDQAEAEILSQGSRTCRRHTSRGRNSALVLRVSALSASACDLS
jgi:ketosteroid isomerase-like protein